MASTDLQAQSRSRTEVRREQLIDILSASPADPIATDDGLDQLALGPFDSVTALAKLAKAAHKARGQWLTASAAEALDAEVTLVTERALEEWHTYQQSLPKPMALLEQDVAAIRAELFLPEGGGVFQSPPGEFVWKRGATRFVILAADINVRTTAGRELLISAPFAAKIDARPVFAAAADLESLRAILLRTKLGYSPVMPPPSGGEPLRQTLSAGALWSKFFPIQTLLGLNRWDFTVPPRIFEIHFDKSDHAWAKYSLPTRGGSIELAKEKGRWVVKRITTDWIA